MTEEERKTLSAIGKHETMSKEPTAREKHKRDNLVDIVGYAACAAECQA